MTVLQVFACMSFFFVLRAAIPFFNFMTATLSEGPKAMVGGGAAIIILGGGLTNDGEPPRWQQERCAVAAKLYHEHAAAGGEKKPPGGASSEGAPPPPRIITLSGGTPWKPPPEDKRGFPITEAAASAKFLASGLTPERLRVPYEDIMEEAFSLDTIGNAYFLRAMHTDPAGIRRLHVVTNQFHMPRTKAIFAWVFSLPLVEGGAPSAYDLRFHTAADAGLDEKTVALRSAKEAASLKNLPATSGRVRSMQALHKFIFDDHKVGLSVR